MQDCGDSACILYEYYVSKASKDNFGYRDDTAASDLGWGVRKVQSQRLLLVKAGYFLRKTYRNNSETLNYFFIGKQEVADNH